MLEEIHIKVGALFASSLSLSLSLSPASFSKAPQNQNRYSLVASFLLDYAAKDWLIAVRSEQKGRSHEQVRALDEILKSI